MNLSLHRPLRPGVGVVTQWFDENPQNYTQFKGLFAHDGVDYGCPKGSEVLAMHAGRVVRVGSDPTGYGLYVKIRGTVCESVYAHLSKQIVKDGDIVEPGTVLGLSGNTGYSKGAHLHVGVRIHGQRNSAYYNYIDFVPFRDI